MSLAAAHLSEVFRWSAEREIEKAEIVAAALGMAAPLLFALIRGDLAPRLTAAMGGVAVGRVEIAAGFKTHLRREVEALAPAILAALLAVLSAGHGWLTGAALVLLSGIASIGGFSRAMAVATTRFILFLMIVSAVATPSAALHTKEAVGFLALVAVGALWTSALSLVLGVIVRWRRRANISRPSERSVATVQRKYARWRRSLTSLAGCRAPVLGAGRGRWTSRRRSAPAAGQKLPSVFGTEWPAFMLPSA